MTPEEIAQLVQDTVAPMLEAHAESLRAEFAEMVKPAEVEAADEAPPAAADESPAEEPVDVAASIARLDAKMDLLAARLGKQAEVAASLSRPGYVPPPPGGGVPEAFDERVIHFRNQGMSATAAVDAATNHKV